MWEEITSYLDNINHPYKLYVSLVDGYYDESIISKINSYKLDMVKIVIVENKGVDIGGFLNVYSSVDSDTDLILKIHSKKSVGLPNKPSDMVKVYGMESAIQKGREWFERNMNGILKNPDFVNGIIEKFETDETCGLIGHNLETYVGPNDFLVKELIKMFGLESNVYGSPFIDGTMFWVRNDLLKKYLTEDNIKNILKIIPKGYHNEPSINHSLERIFGYIIKNENKKVIVI
jgi:lipopolysaccharide biosynthesis protein